MPVDKKKLAVLAAEDHSDVQVDIPIVFQAEDYSCGAAAVLAVLRYYGADDDEEEHDLFGELGTSPADGTDPRAMTDALNERGLKANWRTGIAVDDLRDAANEGVPVILDVQGGEGEDAEGHYVVLVAVVDDVVHYMDPATGDYEEMDADEFETSWYDVDGSHGGIFCEGSA